MIEPQQTLRPVKKKVLIETWGCQMNVADSEQMLNLLKQENYELTTDVAQADLVLLNTCHIREKAKHKVLSRLGVLSQLKQNRPAMKIAVSGCVAQAEGKNLLKLQPAIDILFGPGKIQALPELLKSQETSRQTVYATGFDYTTAIKTAVAQAPSTLSGKSEISRYVNIQFGCDNYCTFCVVPFTRGKEVSRPKSDIVDEVQMLIANGAKEITLLGQNVNSYGLRVTDHQLDESTLTPFVLLLDEVAGLKDLLRLRFTTSNPHDFTKPLAQLFSKQPKLGRYMHLPLQSGSDDILEQMKRKVTMAQYLGRVAWLKAVDQEFAISTDIIVGFPGESDKDFDETLKVIDTVRFSFIYSFKYSPRKHTAAARFKNQVSEEIKTKRLAVLQGRQDQITLEYNQSEIGKTREVLFHYESSKDPGVFYGRTPHFRLVRVKAQQNLVGKLLPVRIVDANKTALEGEL